MEEPTRPGRGKKIRNALLLVGIVTMEGLLWWHEYHRLKTGRTLPPKDMWSDCFVVYYDESLSSDGTKTQANALVRLLVERLGGAGLSEVCVLSSSHNQQAVNTSAEIAVGLVRYLGLHVPIPQAQDWLSDDSDVSFRACHQWLERNWHPRKAVVIVASNNQYQMLTRCNAVYGAVAPILKF